MVVVTDYLPDSIKLKIRKLKKSDYDEALYELREYYIDGELKFNIKEKEHAKKLRELLNLPVKVSKKQIDFSTLNDKDTIVIFNFSDSKFTIEVAEKLNNKISKNT